MNANGERDFSEIELRHAELRKMVYQEFKGASTMTINILLAEGITSKEEARVHIEQKKKIFGLGKVGMQKLCALLGIQGGERKQKLPLTAASIPRAIALLESHGYTVNPPAPATPEASADEAMK